MTIEEKAKAYDELIVKAKELTEDGYIDKMALYDMFPQLRESEDEKIRKVLIKIFEVQNVEGYGVTNEEILSFLEKQDEQKLVGKVWYDAQGDYLPEIDREVVAFIRDIPNDKGMYRVAIAHRPNPNGWDGKSIATGKVTHYEPKLYDKGGWNMPDVKFWLDVEFPFKVE